MKTCNIDGCERVLKSRGYCEMHYLRIHVRGSSNMSPNPVDPKRHGHSGVNVGAASSKVMSGAYSTWRAMKSRCCNPAHKNYDTYGGKLCKEWEDSFEAFYLDMGDRPEGMTIDRINGDLGYYKENCKWSTCSEQNINRRFGKNKENERENDMKLIEDINKEIKKAKAEEKACAVRVKQLITARDILTGNKKKKPVTSDKKPSTVEVDV